jgi:hypothetical protein
MRNMILRCYIVSCSYKFFSIKPGLHVVDSSLLAMSAACVKPSDHTMCFPANPRGKE